MKTSLRTYLVLGRVSNLPTVWSNILCALLITGSAFSPTMAAHLFVGITLLYIGGMYMNDFCDAAHDQAHGKNRPIPAGAISQGHVRTITALLIGAGLATIVLIGSQSAIFGAVLVALITAYNIAHKHWAYSFLLMAACRSTIYLLVGVTAAGQITPAIWVAAGVQFAYVAGVTILARNEENSKAFNPFGLALLGIGFGIALLYEIEFLDRQRIAIAAILLAWIALSLYKARTPTGTIPGKSIAPLLAGISLLDLLLFSSLAAPYFGTASIFVALFALALLAQRFIPAS